MVELTKDRGVTLRTAWVDDHQGRGDETHKDIDERVSPSCPSCGAPLRRKPNGKMYCWFCEKDFDLDPSGSVIDTEIEEDEDDFEMDLEGDGEEEEDPLVEEEELDFDLEIDIEVKDEDDKEERSDEVKEVDQEEEVLWDEEEVSTDIEFGEEEFEIEEDDQEETEHIRTIKKRKVHIRSVDVEFDE